LRIRVKEKVPFLGEISHNEQCFSASGPQTAVAQGTNDAGHYKNTLTSKTFTTFEDR
jgi:hypothetical protein